MLMRSVREGQFQKSTCSLSNFRGVLDSSDNFSLQTNSLYAKIETFTYSTELKISKCWGLLLGEKGQQILTWVGPPSLFRQCLKKSFSYVRENLWSSLSTFNSAVPGQKSESMQIHFKPYQDHQLIMHQ